MRTGLSLVLLCLTVAACSSKSESTGTPGTTSGEAEADTDADTDADPNLITLDGVDFHLTAVRGTASITATADGVDVTTTGRALLRATAGSAEGLAATFTETGGGDRVGVGIIRGDACGNEVQHVVMSQVVGNQKGWQYTCDYLEEACGLDDEDCGAPLGNDADLTDGPVRLGVWIDSSGEVYQYTDTASGELVSTSTTDTNVDNTAGAANRTLVVLVDAQSSEITMQVSDITVGALDSSTFTDAEFAGACRGADAECP